jgi:hypothetical protein
VRVVNVERTPGKPTTDAEAADVPAKSATPTTSSETSAAAVFLMCM